MHLHNRQLSPISRDQFQVWRNDPVTEQLFNDLEHAFIDTCLDPLPTHTMDVFVIEALKREGRREFVDLISEWSPKGTDTGED